MLAAAACFLLVGVGCSAGGRETSTAGVQADGVLDVAYTRQDENVAVANLTAFVLEEYRGYRVTLTETDPRSAVEGVAAGEYDAYQGLWSPAQDGLLAESEDDLNHLNLLGGWLVGTTRAGLAAPSYLGVRDLASAREAGATRAFVLEDSSFVLGGISQETLAAYGLEPRYYPDMSSLWDEAGPLYRRGEAFVVFAYSPNWTSERYELSYLEGEEQLYRFNEPHSVRSVGRPGLGLDDPFVYAMLDGLRLTQAQVESLELAVLQEEGDPYRGAQAWAEDNSSLVASWVYTAKVRTS